MQETKMQFSFGDGRKLLIETSPEVFQPTGTSGVLVDGVTISLTKPEKILDLGCGTGVVGLALSQEGLADGPIYASDLSAEAVELTRSNFIAAGREVIGKVGKIFDPWVGEQFDVIVDDISGVAQEIADISSWFQNVPCDSGADGIALVSQVVLEAPNYLKPGGRLFFPALSLSDAPRLLALARQNFSEVKIVNTKTWPLPADIASHRELIMRLVSEGKIAVEEKFGLMLWKTDIYMASL
jgi:methylase of polypeptide subunit release factors